MNSFSSNVKKELSNLNNLKNKNLVKAELVGYLLTFSGDEFITESEYNINRFGKLLSNIGQEKFDINIRGKNYSIKTKRKKIGNLEIEKVESVETKRAIVRGAFLGSGTVSNPKSVYHLEMLFENKENADYIKYILDENEISSNLLKRENKYLVYIEHGENISNFLAFIGANKSMLEFEDTRIIKEVRNKVNRLVNYETANLNKTISASVKQIEDIKLIKQKRKFDLLSEKEQEIANLRIKNPNASLKELGEMIKPKIGKSGVNHRLQSISNLAESLK